MAVTCKFLHIWRTISSCYGSIHMTLGLIGRDGGLSTLVSWLRVCLSAEGAKNVSWPWLFPLQGWGSVIMALNGKFVYIYIYIYILLVRVSFQLSKERSMILASQNVDIFKEQMKKMEFIQYSEFYVTNNLQLNKLHNETLQNQISVMVCLMTL